MDIKNVCERLQLEGVLTNYQIMKGGNINTTYHVFCKNGEKTNEYLLQKINKNVFSNPAKVMKNIVEVTEYINNHLTSSEHASVTYCKCENGDPYMIDENGDFWRARQYLDCVCFDKTDDLFIIEQAGLAFGEFQYMLDGYDSESLYETIPNFHNTRKRINDLEKAYNYSVDVRRNYCKEEVDYILKNKDKASLLCDLLKQGKLPSRVTHNDTKCNNVVFSKTTLRPLAVIDLDTIMPGLCGYDFGDGARSICCTTMEDEKDLSKVAFNLDKFESFTKGYLTYLKSSLTDLEKQTLGDSIYSMTVELASRFLLDYINGDTYFKISYEDHNLVRTRCQLALAKDIDLKMEKIRAIINKYL